MDAREAFGRPLLPEELPRRDSFGTRSSRRDDVVWLALSGELDAFTASTFRSALAAPAVESAAALVIDLRGLTFIDSSGLAVILGAHERARAAGEAPVRLVIKGSRAVETLFRTIDADTYLHVIDGPEDLAPAHHE